MSTFPATTIARRCPTCWWPMVWTRLDGWFCDTCPDPSEVKTGHA